MSTRHMLRIVGLLNGRSCPFDGKLVAEYDPDKTGLDPGGNQMLCHLVVTDSPLRALKFETAIAALEEWRRPSTVWPRRGDGKPNRPMTAFTATTEPAPMVLVSAPAKHTPKIQVIIALRRRLGVDLGEANTLATGWPCALPACSSAHAFAEELRALGCEVEGDPDDSGTASAT